MSDLSIKDRCLNFLFNNKVILLFVVVTVYAYRVSGVSPVLFLSELTTRFGRNTFLVLSLLIPVVAGIGLNFGIVIGAMAAQISIFLVLVWGGTGIIGLLLVAALATPIAIVFGYLIGSLFNKMKGSEMIGGMVTGLFADGFYQFLLLFVMGGVIPIANDRLMTGTGVGVLNAIDLAPYYMRHALDNVSMLEILTIAFWASIIFNVALVIYKLLKKQPITLKGEKNIRRPIVILAVLAFTFALCFVSERFLFFVYQNRLNGVYASRLAAIVAVIVISSRIVREKITKKQKTSMIKQIAYLVLVAVLFLVSLLPEVANGLSSVRLPVLTYLIVISLCVFIKWFMKTRLGQNLRTVGQSREVATAAGIDVDKTRIIAMILSTLFAAYGQIIFIQNMGVMATFGAHSQVGLYAIAALLVGGATVTRASVKHAIVGVVLFHAFFILAPMAGMRLMGSALIGEYFRVFAANAVIALALIMHAWVRVKKRKSVDIPKLSR